MLFCCYYQNLFECFQTHLLQDLNPHLDRCVFRKMAYFANYGHSWWCQGCRVLGVGVVRESRMERMDGSTVCAIETVPPVLQHTADSVHVCCGRDCMIGESPEPGCEILICYRCNVGGVVVGVGQICGEQMLFTTFSLTSAGSQQTQILFNFQILFKFSFKCFFHLQSQILLYRCSLH